MVQEHLFRDKNHSLIADGYNRTCVADCLNKDIEVQCVVVGIE